MVGKRLPVTILLALVCLAGVSCFVVGQLWNRARTAAEISATATTTSEVYLTQTYGAEVSRAIENFELKWRRLPPGRTLSIP